jgi:hypothetical protein
VLPNDDPERRIREFARQFFRLAAADKLAQACAMLDEPNVYGQTWTPERITAVLRETFSPDTSYYSFHPEGPRFSTPDELVERSQHVSFGAFEDGSGYWYDYAVPLNGEWSDLTAQFIFMRRPEGLAAILHDLHVM